MYNWHILDIQTRTRNNTFFRMMTFKYCNKSQKLKSNSTVV